VLAKAKNAGLLRVGHKMAESISGRTIRVPAYWLEESQ
jgi:hypothetical protein